MYAATRVFFAMSRDGLLPKSFAKVNKKTGAPTFITGLAGIGSSIIAGFIDLKELVNLVNIGSLVTFALVCLSVIILRKSHPNLKRGFMVPLYLYYHALQLYAVCFNAKFTVKDMGVL